MITRKIQTVLLELAASFPVVTMTGPRQSGKTTLAKIAFSSKSYVSLEDFDSPQHRERRILELRPKHFLATAIK